MTNLKHGRFKMIGALLGVVVMFSGLTVSQPAQASAC